MKLVLTGGGTGGHIYPALALYRELKKQRPDTEFLYIGTSQGLESRLVPQEDIPFESIEIQGFSRSLSLKNFQTLYLFGKSVSKSRKILQDFGPDLVLGTGGYVCGPVLYAAKQLKIPSIIHEQNSVAGLTNKFLAPYVDKIAICFEDVVEDFQKYRDKLVLTGNPRGQEIATMEYSPVLADYGLDPDQATVLIFGGSRGAAKINQTFVEAYDQLQAKDYQTLFASGEIYYEDLKKQLDLTASGPVRVVEYIDKMPQVMANVDLVFSRSGATTLAELTALGKASVLVPSPNVTNDHQTKNAQSLVDRQAALMIKEADLTGQSMVDHIDELMLDEAKRQTFSQNAKDMGIPDACDRLIQLIDETLN